MTDTFEVGKRKIFSQYFRAWSCPAVKARQTPSVYHCLQNRSGYDGDKYIHQSRICMTQSKLILLGSDYVTQPRLSTRNTIGNYFIPHLTNVNIWNSFFNLTVCVKSKGSGFIYKNISAHSTMQHHNCSWHHAHAKCYKYFIFKNCIQTDRVYWLKIQLNCKDI